MFTKCRWPHCDLELSRWKHCMVDNYCLLQKDKETCRYWIETSAEVQHSTTQNGNWPPTCISTFVKQCWSLNLALEAHLIRALDWHTTTIYTKQPMGSVCMISDGFIIANTPCQVRVLMAWGVFFNFRFAWKSCEKLGVAARCLAVW